MDVVVDRLFADAEATIGVVRVGAPLCFSLEDQGQPPGSKIPGETRIPAGIYPLRVRTHGGFHTRYAARFGSAHRGMLEICDVPNFTDILIHCGNTDADTAGCLLVGLGASVEPGAFALQSSRLAYRRLYDQVIAAALEGTARIVLRDPVKGEVQVWRV